jgi:Asp-tRNA(Asn)/Glu-tRNA(Gln) amidotransferase B subunit
VIAENPSQADEYREGKGAVLGWFIGQVMQKTGGKADPQAVRAALRELLQE